MKYFRQLGRVKQPIAVDLPTVRFWAGTQLYSTPTKNRLPKEKTFFNGIFDQNSLFLSKKTLTANPIT